MRHRTLLRRHLRPRVAWPTAAIGFLAVLTVLLAQNPTGAAFTASTADTSNSITTATSFCTAPGPAAPITPEGDSWTDPNNTGTNHQGDTDLHVRSSSAGDYYTWIRFVLPTPPHDCTLTGAVLKSYDHIPSSTQRTINVYRGNPTAPIWASSGITWANQPTGVGTAVPAQTPTTANWQSWNVLTHVQHQYTDGNNGFLLTDNSPHAATAQEQIYYDMQNTSGYASQLLLTWG